MPLPRLRIHRRHTPWHNRRLIARGLAASTSPTGIYSATLRDCEIGDNVRISHIRECIVNYRIGSNTCISNVGSIICNGRTAFGNGVKVNVMEETGSRVNLIYDKLSAQISFLQTIYAENTQLIEALHNMIRRYAEEHSSDTGEIGSYVTITDTTRIQNVRILDRATISGASALINGTVGFRATVGCNVIAENFIISSEAVVENSVLVHNAFVGQASQIRNGFTAHDSVFFANCHMECGESLQYIRRPTLRITPQIDSAHCRILRLLQCRLQLQPEQPFIPYGAYTQRHTRTWLQDGQ